MISEGFKQGCGEAMAPVFGEHEETEDFYDRVWM